MESNPKTTIMGVNFDPISEYDLIDQVLSDLQSGLGGRIVTCNTDILRGILANPTVSQSIRDSDFLVADGMPVIWASRIAGRPLPERVTGASLINTLASAAAQRSIRMTIVGGEAGVADKACSVLRLQHPGLDVEGYFPAFGFEEDDTQFGALAAFVSSRSPSIVFCGFGFPKQELVIDRLRAITPDSVYVGSGASANFVAGEVSRAPEWMQRTGTEWLHRLSKEPGRLARRYLLDDAPFAFKMIVWAIRVRFGLGSDR